jgi:hypothetical protein
MKRSNNNIVRYSNGTIHRLKDNFFEANSLCATANRSFDEFENNEIFKKVITNSKKNYNELIIHDVIYLGEKSHPQRCIWIHPILAALVAKDISLNLYKEISSQILSNLVYPQSESLCDPESPCDPESDDDCSSDEPNSTSSKSDLSSIALASEANSSQIDPTDSSQIDSSQIDSADSSQIDSSEISHDDFIQKSESHANIKNDLFLTPLAGFPMGSCDAKARPGAFWRESQKNDFLIKPVVQSVDPLPVDFGFDKIAIKYNISFCGNNSNFTFGEILPVANNPKTIKLKPNKKRKIINENVNKNINYYVKLAIKIDDKNITGLIYDKKIIIIEKCNFYDWYCSLHILNNDRRIHMNTLFKKFAKYNPSNKVHIFTNKYSKMAEEINFIELKLASDIYNFGGNDEKMIYLLNVMRGLNMNETKIYTHRDWGLIDPKYFVNARL